MPAMDEAGNIYLAETGMGHMWKYSPPFPTSEADCPGMDHLVTTAPTKTLFPVAASPTPAAIVRVPGTDHWYVSSVLLPGVPGQGGGSIVEYDANGVVVQSIVENVPPGALLNPLGIDVGSDGTLFHEVRANQRLVQTFTYEGFPDGVTVVDSSQIGVNFLRLPVAVEPDPSTCNGSG